jgi:hypothetical protein
MARLAMRNDRFVSVSGCCQMFVRQCLQAVYGSKYDDYCCDSAKHSAEAWKKGGIGFPFMVGVPLQQGDILYKESGSGGFGHVGIYVGRINDSEIGLVAENSSTSEGRITEAKGYRPIDHFNTKSSPISWIVRLPAPVH